MIRRLQQGKLERVNVRDLAVTLAPVIAQRWQTDSVKLPTKLCLTSPNNPSAGELEQLGDITEENSSNPEEDGDDSGGSSPKPNKDDSVAVDGEVPKVTNGEFRTRRGVMSKIGGLLCGEGKTSTAREFHISTVENESDPEEHYESLRRPPSVESSFSHLSLSQPSYLPQHSYHNSFAVSIT